MTGLDTHTHFYSLENNKKQFLIQEMFQIKTRVEHTTYIISPSPETSTEYPEIFIFFNLFSQGWEG